MGSLSSYGKTTEVSRITEDKRYIVFSLVDSDKGIHVDIREYLNTPKYEGPTKKGIRIKPELMEKIVDCLNEVDAVLRGEESGDWPGSGTSGDPYQVPNDSH